MGTASPRSAAAARAKHSAGSVRASTRRPYRVWSDFEERKIAAKKRLLPGRFRGSPSTKKKDRKKARIQDRVQERPYFVAYARFLRTSGRGVKSERSGISTEEPGQKRKIAGWNRPLSSSLPSRRTRASRPRARDRQGRSCQTVGRAKWSALTNRRQQCSTASLRSSAPSSAPSAPASTARRGSRPSRSSRSSCSGSPWRRPTTTRR